MNKNHIFNSKRDSKKLAEEIISFLKKWGMWEDVQIFTGGKCYFDGENGKVLTRDESNPGKYLAGATGEESDGKIIWKDFSNPERLLDMTFEGSLSLLLRHHEYEVCLDNIYEEAKNIIASKPEEPIENEEVAELMDEYIDGKMGWDPAEFDSYEDWLKLCQYSDLDEFGGEDTGMEIATEFSSREEYEDFILRNASSRESKIREFFEEDLYEEPEYISGGTFYDNGRIVNIILKEFDDLLEKYGLWYELGFSWSLTAYRL